MSHVLSAPVGPAAGGSPTSSGAGGAGGSGLSSRLRGVGARLAEMSMGQRIIASLLVLAVAAGAMLAAVQFSRPSFSPLFTGLSSTDASAVVEQLRSAGVEYQLTDGGTTILVPEESVYDQRLAAAASGLPSGGGTGYALLDEVDITSSEFQQDTTYKRAIEGELAATIGQMDGVAQASVQLAMPQETVFAAEQQEPTASVFVGTDPGSALANQQVQAIVHLTSASVEGMDPTSVSVVDSTGKVLSAVGQGPIDTTGGESERQAMLTTNVQSVLDDLVGAGNSTVAVTVQTTRASSESVDESFADPEGGVKALTEETSTEEYTGSGNPAGTGVLGPDNVANTDAEGGGEAGTGEYSSESETRTNAVDKTTTTTTTPAGEVERQTVAVAVNEGAAGNLTAEQVSALVSSAAGLDAARGDAVTVEMLPFSTADAQAAQQALDESAAAEAAAAQQQLTRDVITYGIAGAVLLIGFLTWLILRRRRTVEPLEDLGEATPYPAMLDRTTGPDTGPVPLISAQEPATILDPPVTVESVTDNERVRGLAQGDPSRAAEMMRSLMEDGARR